MRQWKTSYTVSSCATDY